MILATLTLWAQDADSCKEILEGVVQDIDTKEPVPYALVRIEGTSDYTITDIDGKFRFEGLCDKSHALIISCFGYCDTTCMDYHQHSKTPHFYLKQDVFELGQVTITTNKASQKGIESISQNTLDLEELAVNPTQSLASALSEVEGVTYTSTGSNVELPMIHGLYGNRVLILNNGLKHGFQNWGTDHAPEIDVSSANNVTIVKGAAGVRYGPEALGGAVIVEANPMYLNEALKAQVSTGYQTNGRGYFVNSQISQGLKKWSYHVGANYTRIGDRHAPDYMLTNSGKEEKSMNAGLRYHLDTWDFKAYYSYIDQNLALLRSSVAHSGTSIKRALSAEEPLFVKPFSYEINAPNQLTWHHLGKAEASWRYSDDAKLTFKMGYQKNQREEYDVRRNIDKPIIDLDLTTNDFQLEWQHPDWFKLNGLVGVQAFTQDNDNNPGTGTTPFIPNYNTTRYSGFLLESLKRDLNMFEIGVRVDYEYNNVRGRETNQDIFRDDYEFTNVTTSLGYIRELSENSTFRTNIGSAWRTPNMAELYSFGQHGFKTSFGLLRYYTDEEGELSTDRVIAMSESNITPEKGYKWINEWRTIQRSNQFAVTLYSHYIENYIFQRPIAIIGTIRGPMPVFIYDQADALFIGSDFTWHRKWSKTVDGEYGLSYLWSKNLKKDEPLINQPPITTSYKLSWNTGDFWKATSSRIWVRPSYTFEQFQAPRTILPEDLIEGSVEITPDSEIFDFKDAPEGYFLLDLGWGVSLNQIEVSITVQNVFDKSYRNYLNEMRYFADEPGRNFLFTVKYLFNSNSNQL